MQYQEVGDYIRERMKLAGIESNRELCVRLERIGARTSYGMVSRWLVGRSRPPGARLEALLDALGVVRDAERRAARDLVYLPREVR